MAMPGDFAPVGNGVGIRIEGYVTAIEHVALTQCIEVGL